MRPENVPAVSFRIVHDSLVGVLLVLTRNVRARLLVRLVTQPHTTPLLALQVATCSTTKVRLRDHSASALLHTAITLSRACAPLAPVRQHTVNGTWDHIAAVELLERHARATVGGLLH